MADDKREMVVTDVKIPFCSMVVLLVKWAIAAIPAVACHRATGGYGDGFGIQLHLGNSELVEDSEEEVPAIVEEFFNGEGSQSGKVQSATNALPLADAGSLRSASHETQRGNARRKARTFIKETFLLRFRQPSSRQRVPEMSP